MRLNYSATVAVESAVAVVSAGIAAASAAAIESAVAAAAASAAPLSDWEQEVSVIAATATTKTKSTHYTSIFLRKKANKLGEKQEKIDKKKLSRHFNIYMLIWKKKFTFTLFDIDLHTK